MIVIKLHPIVTSTTKTDSAIDYENPAYVKVQLSLLMILAISSVLSTVLQILTMGENILEENTFMRSELQREKRKQKQESDWKKYYGSCPRIKRRFKIAVNYSLKERY